VEADIGLLFGGQEWTGFTSKIDVSFLTIGLYGKYPIDLGGFTLSPMLGIQIDIGLSAKYNGTSQSSSWVADNLNLFWIKFGASADINITDSIYLRPTFLYGFNFGSETLQDAEKAAKNAGVSVTPFYSGLDIRVAVGFRF